MTEKWIVDDAGTLINMSTRNHYDYMEEVVDVLNKLSEENEQLKQQLKKDNDVLDNTKQKLRDREKAFGELFKDYIDALKQKDELEKKNVQLKKVMNDLKDMLQTDIDRGIRSYPLQVSAYLVEKIGDLNED